MKNAFSLLVLLLLAAAGRIRGAEPSLRGDFRILSSARIGTELFYFDGETFQPCRPLLNRVTAPYLFALTEPELRLFHRWVETNEEGEEVVRHLPVGRAALPGPGSFLLFVSPVYVDPAQSVEVREYQTQLMRNPFVEGRAGQWLFLNFTDHAIVAQIGEEGGALMLPPRGRLEWTADASRAFTLVQFGARIENEPRMFYSSGWPVRPESAYVVVFGPGTRRNPIAVSRFSLQPDR